MYLFYKSFFNSIYLVSFKLAPAWWNGTFARTAGIFFCRGWIIYLLSVHQSLCWTSNMKKKEPRCLFPDFGTRFYQGLFEAAGEKWRAKRSLPRFKVTRCLIRTEDGFMSPSSGAYFTLLAGCLIPPSWGRRLHCSLSEGNLKGDFKMSGLLLRRFPRNSERTNNGLLHVFFFFSFLNPENDEAVAYNTFYDHF